MHNIMNNDIADAPNSIDTTIKHKFYKSTLYNIKK